jgi:FtsZ-binding cell division protein ZapB
MDDFMSKLHSDVAAIGAIVTGFFATIAIGWQKIRRVTAHDKNEAESSHAHTGILDLLHAEINRLAEQNTKLADIVNKLQLEVIDLRNENAELHTAFRTGKYGS